MELLLALLVPERDELASLDFALDVDPSEVVLAVTVALADFAEGRGYGPFQRDRSVLRAGPARRVLRPEESVLDANLVSGSVVVLEDGAPSRPSATSDGRAGVVSVDIAAGPEAGRFIALPPGTYRVGRSRSCDIVIDDPTMSKHHLTVDVAHDLKVTVTPEDAASNGTFMGGAEVSGPRTVAPEQLVQAGATAIGFRPLGEDFSHRRDLLGQIPFNRVPHHRVVVRERTFDPLERPPETPRKQSFPVLASLLPLAIGIVMVMITSRPQFLLITALSPMMLVGRYVSDRRSGRRAYTTGKADFLKRVEARAAEVTVALEEERRERFRAAPDVAELARQARFHHGGLWERQRQDPDLLSLRLGLGDVESKVKADLDRGGDVDLREHANKALAHQSIVRSVPITVELDDLTVLGLFGEDDAVRGLGTSLAIQAACLHSPEDVVVAAAVPKGGVGAFVWLKWLPHTRSATSPLEGDHLAIGSDRTNRLLVNLLSVADERLSRRADREGGAWPRVLLVIHEDAQPDRAILSQLLDVAGPAGIRALWLGHTALQLPRQCRATIAVADPLLGTRSRLRFTDPDHVDREVEIEGVKSDTALEIARSLAPIRDASAATVTTAIPRRVHLLDLLGLPQPDPDQIAQRWQMPRPYGISGALGVAADGPFYLDLVSDGPHALIAGTSGAGKSELLQSLVGSLAASHPPDRLNFLFIDYKGGASSAEFRDLPHAVGYVTNLDGRLSMRALTSLRAELSRRMAILEGRAKDLAEMLTVAPEEAPPSLVIVVDEFATLVKEIPDFVAGIVDIAQRGRSLGIHLVLATQRPTGAVNDNILANTNLRIALRVLDATDSTNVIGSKDAAEIPVPLRGRAYARMGPGRLVGFQCAWSGARFEPSAAARAVTARPFAFTTAAPDAGTAATMAAPANDAAESHLEVLVRACAEAAQRLGLPRPQRPWLEPLDPVIALSDVVATAEAAADPGRVVSLGMIDDPANQDQRPALVDLEAGGGLLIFGAGGAGKTTVLRTIAAAVAQQGSADAVRIYGLDFASRALNQLTVLPQCAAVATGDDPERVTRIITILEEELARRRVALSNAHAETLSALRAATGRPEIARIVVLVDGYGSFQATFDKPDTYEWVNRFQRVVSEGRQVGVHAVITGDRRASVPSALFSAISARLVLRMADVEEMAILGVPSKVAKEADLAPGRGFFGSAEVQVACVGSEPSGASQAAALRDLGRDLASASDARAPALPELREDVGAADLDPPTRRLRVPLGAADLTLATVEVDVARGHFVVTGPPQSGKSAALATFADGLRRHAPELRLVAVGGGASPLSDLALWDDAAFERKKQARVFEDLTSFVADLDGGDVRVVLFLDEGTDVDDAQNRTLEALTNVDAVRLAVALDPATLARGFSGWAGALRRNRALLVLQPESRNEVEQLANVKVRFRPGQEFPPGRGVLVGGRAWDLIQTARP